MPNPIAIVATITTRPEHHAAVRAALVAAVTATLDEPGCEQYALHQDPNDRNRFVMIERWRDAASIDAHAKAPAFRALASVLEGKATLFVERFLPMD
jgi:quinol monooxygenase YgiN